VKVRRCGFLYGEGGVVVLAASGVREEMLWAREVVSLP
jgi:hypothetical protein